MQISSYVITSYREFSLEGFELLAWPNSGQRQASVLIRQARGEVRRFSPGQEPGRVRLFHSV